MIPIGQTVGKRDPPIRSLTARRPLAKLSEINRVLKNASATARAILEKHQERLTVIAGQLIEEELLGGETLKQLLVASV